jgi:hypothetical protein
MKKLVLSAFVIGGIAQTTACTVETVEEGDMEVAWVLTAGDNDELIADCPGDLSTATVISVNDATGEQFIDAFDCVDGVGVTGLLPAGPYTVAVDILDEADVLFAQSLADTTAVDDGFTTVVPTFEFPADGGFFELTWTLTDDTRDLTCAEVAATDVTVFSTPITSGGAALQDVYNCEDGVGRTGKIPVDSYEVIVSLFDAVGNDLGDSLPREVSIDFGNQFEDLGNFEFVFAP